MPVQHMLRAVIHWSGFGEEGALTFNYGGSQQSHSGTELNAAAEAAVDLLENDESPSTLSALSDLLTAGQTIDSFKLYEYDVAPGPATAMGMANLTAAGDGAIVHPLQTAVCVSLLTALPGASYRGRIYMPGHTVAITPGTPYATNNRVDQVADVVGSIGLNIRQGLQQSLSVDALAWIVYSPTKGVGTPIVNVRVDNVLDTQRRRESSLTPSHFHQYDIGANPA